MGHNFVKLFGLDIYHNYFLDKGAQIFTTLNEEEKLIRILKYSVSDFFTFAPTVSTIIFMKKYNFKFLPTPTGFAIAVPAIKSSSSKDISISYYHFDSFDLTFNIYLKDPNFFVYDHLNKESDSIYYFSNFIEQEIAGFPFLSIKTPSYTAGSAYVTNDIVRYQNATYKAILPNSEIPKKSLKWEVLEYDKYVSGTEKIKLRGPIYNYIFKEGSSCNEAVLTISDPRIQDKNKSVVIQNKIIQNDTFKTWQLDLRNLKDGRYKISINGNHGYSDEQFFYLSSEKIAGCFGIVSIAHSLVKDLGTYKLFDAGENLTLLSPSFLLHFLNRSTIWKYIFRKDQNFNDDQLGVFQRDTPDSKTIFITAIPRRLTNTYQDIKKFNSDVLLPNPDANAISIKDQKIYSNIYINN